MGWQVFVEGNLYSIIRLWRVNREENTRTMIFFWGGGRGFIKAKCHEVILKLSINIVVNLFSLTFGTDIFLQSFFGHRPASPLSLEKDVNPKHFIILPTPVISSQCTCYFRRRQSAWCRRKRWRCFRGRCGATHFPYFR